MGEGGARVFREAARILRNGHPAADDCGRRAEGMLQALGYHALTGAARAAAIRLLESGTYIDDLFPIPSTDAPGLHILGGMVDPAAYLSFCERSRAFASPSERGWQTKWR